MLAFSNLKRTLTHPPFARWSSANLLSLIGFWAQRIAVGWLAWELTRSPAWLGILAAAELLPSLVVTPIAGTIADRYPRLIVVRRTQVVSVALMVALTALTFLDLVRIEMLVGFVALHGLIVAVKQPARMALTRELVPREQLGTAISINAMIFNLARFIGPGIAGGVLWAFGPGAVFAATAILYAIMLFLIRPLQIAGDRSAKPHRRGLGKEFVEGLAYVREQPIIAQVLLLQLVLCLTVRGYIELLPAYSDLVLQEGAAGFAMLSAGIGLGAILAGLWSAGRPHTSDLMRIVIGAHALSAGALFLLAITDHLALALLAVVASGFGLAGAGISSQTLAQRHADDAFLGRVLALYGTLFRAGPAVGALILGFAVDLAGFTWPFAIGSITALALLVLLQSGWAAERLRKA